MLDSIPNNPIEYEKMNTTWFWGRLPPWAIMLSSLAIGIVLIIIPEYFGHEWYYESIRDVGVALLVASILGFTIDRWFKSELQKDAFLAAMGRVLPTAFQEEVRRIVSFNLLAEQFMLFVALEPNGNAVKVTTLIERTIKNTSSQREAVKNVVEIDDWGREEIGKSQIEECSMTIDGNKVLSKKVERSGFFLAAETEERTLKRDNSARLCSKWTEYKSANDIVVYWFTTPIINPRIHVTKPENLDCDISFGGEKGDRVEVFVNGLVQQLSKTHFPHQSMSIRFWPKRAVGHPSADRRDL